MSLTVRIDEATHAALRELAEKDRTSLQGALAKAVEAFRRERFFAELEASFGAMTSDELADYHAEAALLAAGNEGLEDEDWSGFDATPLET
jgi:predicted transcriptional regulator